MDDFRKPGSYPAGMIPPEITRDEGLRCSDAERDACAAKLQAHASAGRLTPAELADRLVLVSVSSLRGQLAMLLRDLPPFSSEPAAPSQARASDGDRNRAVAWLTEDYLAGRLGRREHEERQEIALIARTQEELRHALNYLPEAPERAYGTQRHDLDRPVAPPPKPVFRVPDKVPSRKTAQLAVSLGGIAILSAASGLVVLLLGWSHLGNCYEPTDLFHAGYPACGDTSDPAWIATVAVAHNLMRWGTGFLIGGGCLLVLVLLFSLLSDWAGRKNAR